LTSKLKKVKVQDFFQSAKKKTSEKSPLPKTLTYFNNGFNAARTEEATCYDPLCSKNKRKSVRK